MGKFFITCDEATMICTKSQYKEARFSDKLKLTIHMLTCKVCKCYSNQNSMMTKMFGNFSENGHKKEKCLCNEDKEKMEKEVKEKIES